MEKRDINSKEYWDTRFKTNWESMQGMEQTEFFSNIALDLLPDWIVHEIKRDNLSICDIGCAFGDGVNVLGKYFDNNVEGVDFSEEAIKVANSRFPQYTFEVGDITNDNFKKEYDIIYCSNVLEHFVSPWNIVKKFTQLVHKYIILLIPFEEEMQIDEHEYKFLTDKVLININNFSLIYASSIDASFIENTLYADKQILLIYSAQAKNIVTLEDLIGNVLTKKIDNILKEKEKKYKMSLEDLIAEHKQIILCNSNELEQINIKNNDLMLELDSKNQIIINKEKNMHEMQDKLENYEIILKELRSEAEVSKSIISDREKDFNVLSKEIEHLKEVNAELNNNYSYSKDYIYTLQVELQRLHQSFSWKITKIFRIFGKYSGFSKLHYSMINLRDEKKRGFSYTELLLYKIKRSKLYPNLQKIAPTKIKSKISQKYNIPTDLEIQPYENNIEKQLEEFIQRNKENKVIMIISGVKYVDNEGQRNIRLAHEAIKAGLKIVFIYWRWNQNEPFEKSTDNMFQMPIDYFYERKIEIFENIFSDLNWKIMLIEFPHSYANEIADYANCFGWITLYDIIDDWEEFQKKGQAVWYDKKIEMEVANKVDIRIATAKRLRDKIGEKILYKDPFYVISNGVDPNRMIQAQKKDDYCYNEGVLQIGYFGHLTDAWFDWKLITEVAHRNKNWTFHIIGYGEPEKLKLPINIKLYGKKEPFELPYFAAFWDVAIIPFIDCELTLSVNPIKIYEYLQLKLPVVTTNMPEVRNFPYTQITRGMEEFEAAIGNAAGIKMDDELIRNFILDNTWEQKLNSILAAVDEFHPETGYKVIYQDN